MSSLVDVYFLRLCLVIPHGAQPGPVVEQITAYAESLGVHWDTLQPTKPLEFAGVATRPVEDEVGEVRRD